MTSRNHVDITAEKEQLRKRMSSWREQLDDRQLAAQSKAMSQRLLAVLKSSFDNFSAGSRPILGLYNAFRHEADFSSIWYEAQQAGWDLAFPLIVINKQAGTENMNKMIFIRAPIAVSSECYEIKNWFGKGRFGLLEPPDDQNQQAAPDLIIMPGLAFDQDGHRLGWGKAYYDTYLMSAENKHNHVLPLRIAAALDGQIIDKVPHDSHDVKADCILTPSELLCIDKRRSEQFISV